MMIVIMKKDATPSQLTNVVARIEQMGCQAHISRGEERTLVGIIGNGRPFDAEHLENMPGVEKTTRSRGRSSAPAATSIHKTRSSRSAIRWSEATGSY